MYATNVLPWMIRSNTSSRSPFGSSTIWLPIVWLLRPGSKILRGFDQVRPPSLVRENQVGPKKSEFGFVGSRTASRSQTAYALFALSVSAVIDSLSFRKCGSVSRLSVVIGPQVFPWSPDLLTRIALVSRSFESPSEICQLVPVGPVVTHGSDARS